MHPNTARYRLAKIEERTGTRLRRVADVLDLLIAIRVAEAEFDPTSPLPRSSS